MTDHRSLRELQASFAEALVDGRYQTEPGLICECGLRARQRLNVYYHHHRIVQSEALQATYPAILRLVGDVFFADMATLYGDRFPMQSGDLRIFGAQLPDFMETFQPLASLPYLPDVARLEWACHESLHSGETAPPISPSSLARLRLAAHVRLITSPYPVARIWEFALGDHGPDAPRLNIEGAEPDHLLIMRPKLDVEVYALSGDEWTWLTRYSPDPSGLPVIPDEDERPRCEPWLYRGALVPCDSTENQ